MSNTNPDAPRNSQSVSLSVSLSQSFFNDSTLAPQPVLARGLAA